MKDKAKVFFFEKGRKIAVILLTLGIFLIFVSEFIPQKSIKKETVKEEKSETYEEDLTEKIRAMVKAISGQNDVCVTLTLEKSCEQVFAADENTQTGEKEFIILKDKSGAQTLVRVMQYEPEVRGVVIVFKNADNILMKKAVTDAVISLLGISSNRVCVLNSN